MNRGGFVPVIGFAFVATAAIVGCAGGGGSQSSLPATSSGVAVPSEGNATFTLTMPSGTTTSAGKRAPAYLSPNAQSISIAVAASGATPGAPTIASLASTSPNCTTTSGATTCAISLAAPVGTDSFSVALFASTNGSGTPLSSAVVNATIAANTANAIPITLNGTVASISVSVTNGNNRIPGGYATTLPVVVTAYDASGATIVGPGNYTNPITLTNADTSGITALSTTTVTSPSTTVTLTYAPSDANSGVLAITGLPVGATQIGATASGVAASAVTSGTFQYIADRFWGFGHTRTLSGTGTVSITSYNSSGSPLPSPSVYAYNVTEAVTVHPNMVVNGVSTLESDEVYAYTQTSPSPSATAEVVTDDKYRQWTLNTTGATYFRYGETLSDLNPGTASSPITGSPPGAITSTFTYPTSGTWQEDVLPHASVSWSNSAVPFTEVFSVGETATFQHYADGTDSLIETSPAAVTNTETTAGAAVHTTMTGTTTISPPVAPTSSAIYTIPVAQQSTSPSPGPTVMYSAADWYTGNAAPVQPLDAFTGAEQLVAIPTSCNVPSSVATQAWDVVTQQTALRIYSFGTVRRITLDYFAPGGVGFVCETYSETDTSYRYTTGIISQQTIIVYTMGVTSVGSLSVVRRH